MSNLNHIHLHVTSVKRAAAFYERYFGMRELVWHGDMVFMRDVAGMDLALAPCDALEPFPAWFHIGFRLESKNAVEALFDRVKADGIPIREPFTSEGDLSFFRCNDPDGYQIEVYYEPDPA
ncbi:MAG TPA: VOC family protein [Rhizomicrobium sp.]|jgi:catechol 2,3-dioxygenase-like lactoylglutathione lyase family enzyme|nr:VOC family protein [Rhizomicrobium sp.]